MKPLLSAVGIHLKVNNIAQGGNGCFPSDWYVVRSQNYITTPLHYNITVNLSWQLLISFVMYMILYNIYVM